MKVEDMVRDYRTLMSCSSNEFGQREIKIEYRPGLIRTCLALLGYPVETEATFVSPDDGRWLDKSTGASLSSQDTRSLERLYRMTMNMKF